jgi:hypothetical protein
MLNHNSPSSLVVLRGREGGSAMRSWFLVSGDTCRNMKLEERSDFAVKDKSGL